MSKARGPDDLVLMCNNDQVTTISINRPQRHNSLVPELLQQLIAHFNEIKANSDTKVVVLRAVGDSFSTGGDLRAFWENRDDLASFADALVGNLNNAIASIVECDVPAVVAVDGQVTGGSLGLVLACDIAVITERASFTPYYVDVGFSPDGGWTAMLPQIIGQTRATAVQLLNASISAQQAVDWGIAYQMTAVDQLDRVINEICGKIKEKKSDSLRLTRELLSEKNFRDRLDAERSAFVKKVVSKEALDGIETFVGKRQ